MSEVSPAEIRKPVDAETRNLNAQCSPSPSKQQRITHERVAIHAPPKLQLSKQLRNIHAPISEIANEILVEIFTRVNDPERIAQVCQHWRALALGTPSLWTHLSCDNHARTMRFLKRSKNAPLNVYIGIQTNFDTTCAVLKNYGRIRNLNVCQTGGYLQYMGWNIPCRARHLENLSIKNEEEEEEEDDDFEPFVLPLNRFGNATKLHKLHLENVRFDWRDLMKLPALTHLSLQEVKVTHPVTGKAFTNALRRIHLLQYLSISFGDIELKEYSSATLFEPIHLPELTTLDIRWKSGRDHINHFLSHATLPRLHTLNIDYGNDPIDHSPSVQALSSAIRKGDFHPLQHLAIMSGMIRIATLRRSNTDPGGLVEIMLPLTHDDLDINSDFTMATHILSCVTPIGSKDLSSLMALHIESLDLTSDELRGLFGGLPHLIHVAFSWKLAGSFVAALSVPPDHKPDCPISFLKLTSIEWLGNSNYNPSPYPNPYLFDKFIDCLIQRCEYGAPIHNLRLKYCKLARDEVDVRLLKDIVVDVHVSSSFW